MRTILRLFLGSGACFAIALGSVKLTLADDGSSAADAGELAAVRRAAESYASALRQGDADQVAAFWTAEGNIVDSEGRVTAVRTLVQQLRAGLRPGTDRPSSPSTIDSLRLVTPDVAIEDARINLSAAAGTPLMGRYSALWVKRGGKWLLDSVRESAPHAASHHDVLLPLQWLVGQWAEDSGKAGVEVKCDWSPDGNYLLREIKVPGPPGQYSSLSQRIGWDAGKKEITAWTFDSDGGHASGVWSPQGNKWVVKSTGVLPDGQTATSVSTYTRQGDDAFVWEATHVAGVGSPAATRVMRLVRRKSAE